MTRNVALIYVRQSRTDADDQNNYSPETQRGRIARLPELEGLSVVAFEDLDISGKSAQNRPAYQRLLARLGPDVRYVAAYDLSRLTRDVGDLEDLLKATRLHGVQILDAMNGATTRPDRPRDKFVARIQGVVNQNYLEELSEKISDALATKVASGETVGPPPLGYRRNREILPNGKIARVWMSRIRRSLRSCSSSSASTPPVSKNAGTEAQRRRHQEASPHRHQARARRAPRQRCPDCR